MDANGNRSQDLFCLLAVEREPLLLLLESNGGQTAAAANLRMVTLVGGGVVRWGLGVFFPLCKSSLGHRNIPVGAEEGK